ncbi:MAG TPA: hypothetical protein VK616_10850 [Flavitalea sp.]|nr:hypothetical protein [Flavitalea sp.]
MFKNYLKIALRSLFKNKTFSIINIVGLSLGLTCSFLILLWVNDEKNVDGFFSNTTARYTIIQRAWAGDKKGIGYYTPAL